MDNNFVTVKELEEYVNYRFTTFHSKRWALITIWIIVFSTIVFYVTWTNHSNTNALKQSRFDIIVNNCIQQNERHDRTIAKLDNRLRRVPKHQAYATRTFTVLLIDQIVPKHNDCGAYARRQIKESNERATATR